jgi:hypothetical protein
MKLASQPLLHFVFVIQMFLFTHVYSYCYAAIKIFTLEG